MVGRLLSFWGGPFSGAMLNFQGVMIQPSSQGNKWFLFAESRILRLQTTHPPEDFGQKHPQKVAPVVKTPRLRVAIHPLLKDGCLFGTAGLNNIDPWKMMIARQAFYSHDRCKQHLHSGRLTWNLKITYLKRKIIFQTSIIMFHVNLRGCRDC